MLRLQGNPNVKERVSNAVVKWVNWKVSNPFSTNFITLATLKSLWNNVTVKFDQPQKFPLYKVKRLGYYVTANYKIPENCIFLIFKHLVFSNSPFIFFTWNNPPKFIVSNMHLMLWKRKDHWLVKSLCNIFIWHIPGPYAQFHMFCLSCLQYDNAKKHNIGKKREKGYYDRGKKRETKRSNLTEWTWFNLWKSEFHCFSKLIGSYFPIHFFLKSNILCTTEW